MGCLASLLPEVWLPVMSDWLFPGGSKRIDNSQRNKTILSELQKEYNAHGAISNDDPVLDRNNQRVNFFED